MNIYKKSIRKITQNYIEKSSFDTLKITQVLSKVTKLKKSKGIV